MATGRDPAPTARPLFPVVTGRRRGYHRAAVDAFLSGARESYEAADAAVDAATVRAASFPMVRGGYQVDAVDRALARLEDALAAREREHAVAARGAEVWVSEARTVAQEILDRVTRPSGRRFDRVGFLRFGYRVDEVDHVGDRIADFLRTGQSITVEQVRTVAFRMQRGGYREEQVDAVLDAITDVILAVR